MAPVEIDDLDLHVAIQSALPGQDSENLILALLDPDKKNPEELGIAFQKVCGYNPLTYLMRRSASRVLTEAEKLSLQYPDAYQRIHQRKSELIEKTVREYESDSERNSLVYASLRSDINETLISSGDMSPREIGVVMGSLDATFAKTGIGLLEETQEDPDLDDMLDEDDSGDNFDDTEDSEF